MSAADGEPAISACIGLGSNLGDRAAHIREALRLIGEIRATRVEAVSAIIETPALRVAAADPGGPYLNAAASVRTALAARDLLEALAGIEHRLGRDRLHAPRGSARTIDLDLLLHGTTRLDEPGLTIPHPRLHERLFVLEPMAQVAPDAHVPGRGRVADLLAALRKAATVAALCVAGCVPLVASVARAQPVTLPPAPARGPEAPARVPVSIDPAIVFQEMFAAYSAGPTAERITVTLRLPGRPARDAEVVVRLDPGAAKGASPRPEALAVEMGVLRLHASAGILQITTTENAEVLFRADFAPGEALSPALVEALARPLPVLPLAILRSGGDPRRLEMGPLLPALAWREARLNPKEDRPAYVLSAPAPAGVSGGGDFVLVVDAASGRVRSLSGPLPGAGTTGGEASRFELACAALAPGDPARWRPDSTGRRRVPTIGDLRRGAAGGELAAGQRFPVESVRSALGGVQGERPVTEWFAAGATHAAMVLYRPGAEGADARGLVAALGAISLAAHWPGLATVGVLCPEAGPAPEGVRASLAAARALERLLPASGVGIVLIDRSLTLRAVMPVDPEDRPETLAGLVVSRMGAGGPAEGP